MIAIIWNCRGLGQPATVRSLSSLVSSHRPNVVFLSEIKSSNKEKIQKIALGLGFPCTEFIPSVGSAGGLLLCWNNNIDLKVVVANNFLINCMVFDDPITSSWQFTAIYGPPTHCLRAEFWDSKTRIGATFSGPWIVIGDFNMILDQADKNGGRLVSTSSTGGLRKFIDDNGLIDLGFKGYAYTWTNRRMGNTNIQERLDRGFANSPWRILFPEATVTHLSALQSDHRPILLHTSPPSTSKPKPFRFEAMWVDHPDSAHLISNAWTTGHRFLSKLKSTKLSLKAWNQHVFGHLQTNIRELRSYIDHLQSLPQTTSSLRHEEAALQ